jgi:hypothetical protein
MFKNTMWDRMNDQTKRENTDGNEVMARWNDRMNRLHNESVGMNTRRFNETPADRLFSMRRRMNPTQRLHGYRDFLNTLKYEFSRWSYDVPLWAGKAEEQRILELKYVDAMRRIDQEHAKMALLPLNRDPMWRKAREWIQLVFNKASTRLSL